MDKEYIDLKNNTIQADYFTYPFGENCYDAAVSFETLHHFTMEKKRLLFYGAGACRKFVCNICTTHCSKTVVSQSLIY